MITIPRFEWTPDPRGRDTFEQLFKTPLSGIGHEFTGRQAGLYLGTLRIARDVAAELAQERGADYGIRVASRSWHENPDSSFSRGIILLAAESQALAQRLHPELIQRVNTTLTGLGAACLLG